jgi:hypothetical protein
MPTYVRPSRVVIDEGGSGAAIAVLLAAAAVAAASSVLAIIVHALILILIAAAVLAAAGIAWLVRVLRRDELRMWHPAVPASEPAEAAPAPQVTPAPRWPEIEPRRQQAP